MSRLAFFWRVVISLALVILLATLATRIVDQERTIASLHQQNAKLTHDAATWKDLALRFEHLNRECLALCYGAQ